MSNILNLFRIIIYIKSITINKLSGRKNLYTKSKLFEKSSIPIQILFRIQMSQNQEKSISGKTNCIRFDNYYVFFYSRYN